MAQKKTEEAIPRELQSDVAKKYKLKTIRAGLFKFAKFGEIDLRKIDLKQADALVKEGFPYLELKAVETASPKKGKEKEVETPDPLDLEPEK